MIPEGPEKDSAGCLFLRKAFREAGRRAPSGPRPEPGIRSRKNLKILGKSVDKGGGWCYLMHVG